MLHRFRRLPLLLLAFLLVLTACDPKAEGTGLRINRLSTTTPSVGGDLIIRGRSFSSTYNTVTIGGMTIPETNITSLHHSEIKLIIPAGTPNGTLTVTTDGDTASYATPLHIITSLEVDPLERIQGTQRFSITARARDADGQPVPGAPLLLATDGEGTITPSQRVTTDGNGVATGILDLEGVTTYVSLSVWAPPLYAVATYTDPGNHYLGTRVTLRDGPSRMPLYIAEEADGQVIATTLNRKLTHPPIPQLGPASISSTIRRSSYTQEEPTEIIVAYHPTLSLSSTARTSVIKAAGLEPDSSAGGLHLARVPAGESLEAALERLNADPSVAYAEPNYTVRMASLPSDPELHKQWGAFAVGAPAAWSVTDGEGIIVAVVDSAIDLTHPDLKNALLPGYDFCADNRDCTTFDDDPHSHTEDANHGTHIAGTIAAAANNGHGTVGIAPGAKILPVKVFAEGSEVTTTRTIALAIRWAAGVPIEGVPLNPAPAQVINLSLGGEQNSQTLEDAVNDAIAAGAVVVAAAGNDYGDLPVNYPAALPNVLGVGAIADDWKRADFSNYGPGIDLVAPGAMVYASQPGGGAFYMVGTSMATPHAAAAAALLLAQDPTLSPAEVKNRLKDTTYWPTGASANEFGAGVLRIDGALGIPAPTNDIDRYAQLTIGELKTTLDLRDGLSPSFTLPSAEPGAALPISLTQGGRTLTGSLTHP